MKARQIKFVREYMFYGYKYYDVIYESGRLVTVCDERMPKTVKQFIEKADDRREQYDRVFKREELLYMKKEA